MSPFIYALYTYDFFSRSYLITAYIKYSVDKAILALTDSFTTHQQPVAHLTHWLTDNQLLLRVFKVKELIFDICDQLSTTHCPTSIKGQLVESFKHLSIRPGQ